MESLKTNLTNCSTILTGVSHEMRTHMNAIVAFSFLMKENSCNNLEREEFCGHIFSSCEQLIELFDSFLDAAKIDTGKPKSELRICRLDNMLDDLLSEFIEIIRKEGNTGLELLKDIRVPDSAKTLIDQNMILMVIRSLFRNANKNTSSGYIKIGMYSGDDKLTFYVLDSGKGFVKCKEFLYTEDINDSLALYNDTYTAINITLARQLTRIMGGKIWIEHNEADGAGIYFSIPAKITSGSNNYSKKQTNSMMVI